MARQKNNDRPPVGALVEITEGKTTKVSRGTVTRHVGQAAIEIRCKQYVLVVSRGEYRTIPHSTS